MKDQLKDIMYSDLFRYTGNARRTKNIYTTYLQELRSSPEFSYISCFRRTRFYYDEMCNEENKVKKFIAKCKFTVCNWYLDKLSRKYHIQIPYDTNIGKGFYLAHFGRVIIHPKSVIGYNCNVSTGVVIGTQFRGKRKGSPHIGNFVWIGANAVIVGKINIGNNVLIAPGAYVNFDVPDGSIVLGNPGLIRRAPGATLSYINNTISFDEYNVRSDATPIVAQQAGKRASAPVAKPVAAASTAPAQKSAAEIRNESIAAMRYMAQERAKARAAARGEAPTRPGAPSRPGAISR